MQMIVGCRIQCLICFWFKMLLLVVTIGVSITVKQLYRFKSCSVYLCNSSDFILKSVIMFCELML